MVKLRVLISMELEGVTDVQPADDDYEYFFTVQCSSCREVHPKTISFNQKEEHEISGSKGSAHFVWRCTNCKVRRLALLSFYSACCLRISNTSDPSVPPERALSLLPPVFPPPSKSKSTAPLPYSTSPSFAPFIALDCRGLEFTEFHFRGRWKASAAESGERFEIDWDELAREQGGEERWDDYDEAAGEAVSVSELKSKIERA